MVISYVRSYGFISSIMRILPVPLLICSGFNGTSSSNCKLKKYDFQCIKIKVKKNYWNKIYYLIDESSDTNSISFMCLLKKNNHLKQSKILFYKKIIWLAYNIPLGKTSKFVFMLKALLTGAAEFLIGFLVSNVWSSKDLPPPLALKLRDIVTRPDSIILVCDNSCDWWCWLKLDVLNGRKDDTIPKRKWFLLKWKIN